MSAGQTEYFVIGGTLQRDAPSYVVRQADQDLLRHLQEGHFCYVLTSRQLGKSSLMVRTAGALRAEGAAVAILDMTAIGQNLSVQQWYDGLLYRIGAQLHLEDALEDYITDHPRLSPLQVFTGALRDVVLEQKRGLVILLIDEIDAVRSLPFPTDEFFAAIREFYNRRTQDPELKRLAFCLLGVASPSDLIRDPRTTPFNIGQRIELKDFTTAEVSPLIQGLGLDPKVGKAVLERILYYTGGHPYLTQRLCHAVVKGSQSPSSAPSPATGQAGASLSPQDVDRHSVDKHCQELFLSHRASERDDNLLFVRQRLLGAEGDLASLLLLVEQAHTPRKVRDDELDPLVSVLRLSGIVRSEEGFLQIRNRIYAHTFDKRWVRANLPQAELLRQKAAFQQGIRRAAAISAVIFALMALLIVVALQQRNEADRARQAAQAAEQQARTEARRADEAKRIAEAATAQAKTEAQRASTEAARAAEATREAEASSLQAKAEATRANREAHQARLSRLSAEESRHEAIEQTARAKDLLRVTAFHKLRESDPTLASLMLREVQGQGRVPGWRQSALESLAMPVSAMLLGRWTGEKAQVALSADGSQAAILALTAPGLGQAGGARAASSRSSTLTRGPGSSPLAAVVVRVNGNSPFLPLPVSPQQVSRLSVCPDGSRLALALENGQIDLLKLDTPRSESLRTIPLRQEAQEPDFLDFSPDCQEVYAGVGGLLTLIPLEEGPVRVLQGHRATLTAALLSPDGHTLYTASRDGTVRAFSLPPAGSSVGPLKVDSPGRVLVERSSKTTALSLSADGSRLAVGFADGQIQVFKSSLQAEDTLRGHTARITALQLSNDGQRLLSASADGTARVWRLGDGSAPQTYSSPEGAITAARLDASGSIVGLGSRSGLVRIWIPGGPGAPRELRGHQDEISGLAFRPADRLLISASRDGTIRAWSLDAPSGVDGTLSDAALQARLASRTSACVPPSLRTRFLAETEGEAERAFWTCEHLAGRAP